MIVIRLLVFIIIPLGSSLLAAYILFVKEKEDLQLSCMRTADWYRSVAYGSILGFCYFVISMILETYLAIILGLIITVMVILKVYYNQPITMMFKGRLSDPGFVNNQDMDILEKNKTINFAKAIIMVYMVYVLSAIVATNIAQCLLSN